MDELHKYTITEMQFIRNNIELSDEELARNLNKTSESIKLIRKRLKRFEKREGLKTGKRAKNKRSTTMYCSACKEGREISAKERYRTAKVKCWKCGGPMNRKRDSKLKIDSNKGLISLMNKTTYLQNKENNNE